MESSNERDEVLDVRPVEWRNERAPHRDRHLPRDLVGLVLALGNDAAIALDIVAALEHAAQRLGAGDYDRRVLREQREEPLLLGH